MNFGAKDIGVTIKSVGVGDIKDYDNIEDIESLTTISLNEMPSEEYMLKDGDLVFVRSNGNKELVGRCVAVYPHETPVSFSGFCIRFRKESSDVLLDYLLRYLKMPEVRAKMAGRGANIQNLNQKILAALQVPVPPLETQMAYVAFVRQSDKSKFACLKSQFIEMFSYENDDIKIIDDVANICRGASPRPIAKYVTDDENGVNWIKIGDVTDEDIYITQTAEKITEEGAKKSRAVEPGDFILSNSMSFGRPYIVGIQGCVHDGWLIISDYQDYLDPLFFYYERRSDLVQRQFDGSANGSCVKNLNSDLVKKVKIHVPSMDKQKEFIEFAEQSDKSKLCFHLYTTTLHYSHS